MSEADAQHPDAFTLLTTDPPSLPEAHAAKLLREHYGMEGRLEPQESERDQNFLLCAETGHAYVLKVANSSEPEAVTDFQIAALLHLERTGISARVPKVIRTKDGDTHLRVLADDGRTHTARVLSWLPGVQFRPAAMVPGGFYRMGEALASLGKALHDFDHAASDYPLLWDIKQAEALRELLGTIEDTRLRSVLAGRLDTFGSSVRPRLLDLRSQVIHNDLNPDNVLFREDDAGEIAGIIDFGDMIRSPLVVDVAVACAYLCRSNDASLADMLEFLRGYNSVTPLTDDEFELLPHLVTTRNVATIVISHWRASLYPDNRAYILRSAERALRTLNTFGQQPPAAISRKMQEYCDSHD